MSFPQRLEKSGGAVFYFGLWLHLRGIDVDIPGMQCRPEGAHWQDYVDHGDLFMRRNGSGWKRVGVKHSGYDFAQASDWRYDKFFVCGMGSHDRAEALGEVPYVYVIMSKRGTHAAFIYPEESRATWTVKNAYAPNTGKFEDFYCCPFEHIHFIPLRFTLHVTPALENAQQGQAPQISE